MVQAQYRGTCRVELSDLFWHTAKARLDQSKKTPKRRAVTIIKEGHRHELQKTLLGLLVHYPAFLEEKEERIAKINFEAALQKFHQALYELLVASKELSVEVIYQRLSPTFYQVLEDIHGHETENLPRGNKLFARFPIVKIDPPLEFVSECIDHFANILFVEQLTEELENVIAGDDPLASEATGAQLMELVRYIQAERELVNVTDTKLAERAKDLRNSLLGPAEYRRMAA